MVMEGYQRGAWCLGSGQGLDCDTGVFYDKYDYVANGY